MPVSGQDIARLYGVTTRTVQYWVRREGCPKIGDNIYNLTQVIRWREEWWKDKLAGKNESEQSARNRLASALANIRELELEQMRGKLINVNEALDKIAGVISAARSKLLALPRRVAPIIASMFSLPNKAAEIESIISKVLQETLDELSTIPTEVLSTTTRRRTHTRVQAVASATKVDYQPMG